MKNPWVAFAGICSLVLGIVLFSVVFGGYSSFLRSRSRIEAATHFLVDQSRNQLAQARELAQFPGVSEQDGQTLSEGIHAAAGVLDRMEKSKSPLSNELISEYLSSQVRVTDSIDKVLKLMPDEHQALKQMNDLKTAVFIAGRRYNKEAGYFNTRTQVFPGFIIARIFGFDKIRFSELALDRLTPYPGKEASGAS